MLILQTIIATITLVNWGIELLKSFIVALPVVFVTITIWQINVYTRKKREKHRIIARYSPLLSKYANFFYNIERSEIQFQLAGVNFKASTNTSDKEYWKKNLTIIRNSIDKLQLKWLEVASELAELYNILLLYIDKEPSNKLHKMLMDLSKTNSRQFVEYFENVTDLSTGKQIAKDLLKQITDENETTGVMKKAQDISDFLQNVLRNNKCNAFNSYYCYYCCYCDIIDWFL